ncbi:MULTISPECIES: hypothetical protein [unclassified Halanaerobium]|uniref:hypothetical protein n=1 Tax=unclassified Halanaerobium TaxID=2641197 RepID=UPI000DF2C249|nr:MULTISPECIES: hypothetical protein [unclassified Halanaerobium]RCW48162.1 hypothetical protein DFR78_11017 [Halanaerobium sp. MA284_MarDTE_T2]RCW80424.1 hypothetical protein DER71_13022 [Halanaerobium sp. DL-01]
MIKIILGILLFAIATAIIYAWGYVNSQRNSQKLQYKFKNLVKNKIIAILKNNNKVERKKLESAIEGLEVKGGFFSGISYKVTDPEKILESILYELERKNIIKIIAIERKVIKYKFLSKSLL